MACFDNTLPANACSQPLLSFVVIGYNESATLSACIRSIREAELSGVPFEVIYVDGGSNDGSLDVARAAGCDLVLAAEERRKAPKNRNVGAAHAKGTFLQFLDGDMVMAPSWPKKALEFIVTREDVGVVFGELREMRSSFLYKILELDWIQGEGEVAFCGGAAIFRRSVFIEAGGFPEDVSFGEEPLLCWRIRNHLHKKVMKLSELMAYHDLAFRGFSDYWRRCVRSGWAYAEVSHRCAGASDRMWQRECRANYRWAAALLAGLMLLLFAPIVWRLAVLIVAGIVLFRKTFQVVRKGHPWSIALGYAVHTYFAKLPLAYGQIKWSLVSKRLSRNNKG
ncbi:MAG TPA: glycosyltransferase [Candidatus Hydrogenedentes bacterium]|nr:glycosyltransferase [Candidatus Hydrogenedentota bacterium]HOL76572.1 glycosyltransferase [Candidatus Hydrogenedentota bacterium]HPO85235.1 glycosyltransferase [Candidatus Hydrogenedentota bacterium]